MQNKMAAQHNGSSGVKNKVPMLASASSPVRFKKYARELNIYLNSLSANAGTLVFNEFGNMDLIEDNESDKIVDIELMEAEVKDLTELVADVVGGIDSTFAEEQTEKEKEAASAEGADGADADVDLTDIDDYDATLQAFTEQNKEEIVEYIDKVVDARSLGGEAKKAFKANAAEILMLGEIARLKTEAVDKAGARLQLIQEIWTDVKAKIDAFDKDKADLKAATSGPAELCFVPKSPTLEALSKLTTYAATYAVVMNVLKQSFGSDAADIMNDTNLPAGVEKHGGAIHKMFAKARTKKSDVKLGIALRSQFMQFYNFEWKMQSTLVKEVEANFKVLREQITAVAEADEHGRAPDEADQIAVLMGACKKAGSQLDDKQYILRGNKLEEIYELMMADAKGQDQTPGKSPALLATTAKDACRHCHKKGHFEQNCWEKHPEKKPTNKNKKKKPATIFTGNRIQASSGPKEQTVCFGCHQKGHYKNACTVPKDQWPSNKDGKTQANVAVQQQQQPQQQQPQLPPQGSMQQIPMGHYSYQQHPGMMMQPAAMMAQQQQQQHQQVHQQRLATEAMPPNQQPMWVPNPAMYGMMAAQQPTMGMTAVAQQATAWTAGSLKAPAPPIPRTVEPAVAEPKHGARKILVYDAAAKTYIVVKEDK